MGPHGGSTDAVGRRDVVNPGAAQLSRLLTQGDASPRGLCPLHFLMGPIIVVSWCFSKDEDVCKMAQLGA